MQDGMRPPRKFTTLRHKYMDLRTSEDLEVFHIVIPWVETTTRSPTILYLAGNAMAKDLSAKNCSLSLRIVVAHISAPWVQQTHGKEPHGML